MIVFVRWQCIACPNTYSHCVFTTSIPAWLECPDCTVAAGWTRKSLSNAVWRSPTYVMALYWHWWHSVYLYAVHISELLIILKLVNGTGEFVQKQLCFYKVMVYFYRQLNKLQHMHVCYYWNNIDLDRNVMWITASTCVALVQIQEYSQMRNPTVHITFDFL